MNRSKIFFVVLALMAVAFSAAAWSFWDIPVRFFIESSTGWEVSYLNWGGNPFKKTEMVEAEFVSDDLGLGLRSRKVMISPDIFRYLNEKKFYVDINMRGVELLFLPTNKEDIRNIFELITSSGETFLSVDFSIEKFGDLFAVRSLRAISSNFEIAADLVVDLAGNKVETDINISVSPGMVRRLPTGVRGRILTLQEDGSYGSQLSYSGDPSFLKILFESALAGK